MLNWIFILEDILPNKSLATATEKKWPISNTRL